MSKTPLPLIGVTGDTHPDTDSNYYKVGDKYMLSVVRAAKGLAVMIPPIGDELEMDALLDHLARAGHTGGAKRQHPVGSRLGVFGAHPVHGRGRFHLPEHAPGVVAQLFGQQFLQGAQVEGKVLGFGRHVIALQVPWVHLPAP